MPFTKHNGVRLYWKEQGSAELPAIVLINSIGTDMSLWDKALPHLLPHYRLIRLDNRGHGASDAPGGDYSLDVLGSDTVAVMDAANVEKAIIAGISLGGMIAMDMAINHPRRVAGLALICTSATMDKAIWTDRVAAVRSNGTEAIADAAINRFFSPKFIENRAAEVSSAWRALVNSSDTGYAGCAAAIRDMDIADRLGAIAVPTLVITGDDDISTPFLGHGEFLAASIPDAKAVRLKTGHLPAIEDPAALASAIVRFFGTKSTVTSARDILFEAGLVTRRAILGDEWVDRSLAGRTSFNEDFQAMITRIAWNEIWSRPGLDERTRRLIVVATTASLGRWEEYALHVRAGLAQGGFTQDELKEVLMQIAIYAGVPVANTAFGEATKIISEIV
ncbi:MULTISPECIES: bifunctional 3-oxoadipate enol-lactonase/4-carboxymuconolactone decarboxylase PcaDC [Pseudomonadota]|uniref:bifunctional 3-oxoadipate enol-lactonase/4-carboxymuconolactone decarboxylase PcaDC n=1 Tax=Pseudomonadota TaxID=1224 RepID=UPI0012BB2E89|nr:MULTISPECIES: 3-oxoadipate enol-lactonase [Pseudomonadota]MCE4542290.1 3-oxoadipate enol-lactonase [Caballeronia sp. PC1]MCE4545029.1 3-oxoadipate enol-lactonase [Caballeronia sp. PC1]MCE4570189.1 3-oxoadipate enol-lactonase [Caballeronia sp. CLC5]MCE4570455.1 3-oxoadipate enol-lactonase [Caballeronia sp. CLC5]QGP77764.1 3-oxoadipate enol-lactonase [Sphingobium sp. CAP-1]